MEYNIEKKYLSIRQIVVYACAPNNKALQFIFSRATKHHIKFTYHNKPKRYSHCVALCKIIRELKTKKKNLQKSTYNVTT